MTDPEPASTTITTVSGGADLNAGRDITIGGDVVGRDKIVSNTTIFTGDQQYDVRGLANPYLGLQSFTYADHAKYAGREKLIAETVARLTVPDDPLSLVFVTGASGSGKSSFVQAGVLPALEKHYAALSVKWAVFRPSHDPLAALADALWRQLGLPQYDAAADFGDFLKVHTPIQQVNVIVIDQFEELFTQSNTQPRDALFALLMQLPPFRSTRTHIIATVRADYLPELFALRELYDIAKRGIDLHKMSVDELREAIQQPLRATYPDNTKRFQPELVERLAQDAAEDAAYLPLLQVTLEEIWRKGTLTVGSYTNLADAIKQRADKVLAYQDYDAAQPNQPRAPEEQAAILNLCLDLVDVSLDDEARRDVRRRRSKDELISGAHERARLIDTLAQARLLSVSTDSGEPTHVEVDLIHETLLSNWDRLKEVIAERRHELRQRVRFEQQLKEGLGQNRSDDYLLSGVRLAEARELERRGDIALHNDEARDFVRCSMEHEEAHRQKELDDARRRVVVFSVVAIVALIAAGIAFFLGDQSNRNADLAGRNAATAQVASTLAVSNASTAQAASTQAVSEANIRATAEISTSIQRDEAQRQARIIFSRRLAAQALSHLDNQLDLAMLLAREAYSVDQTIEAGSSLLSTLQHGPLLEIEFPLRDHISDVASVAFSPDGKTLASGSNDKTIILWNITNPRAPTRLGMPLTGHTSFVWSVTFSPNANILASGSHDKTIILWDVTDPYMPTPFGMPLVGHAKAIQGLAFSPDGRTLASVSDDATIILWDVTDPHSPKQLGVPLTDYSYVSSVAFSPDGKTLAAGSYDKIILWDVTDRSAPTRLGKRLLGHLNAVSSVAFSPDGKTLASGSYDRTIILWDVTDRRVPVRMGTPLVGHRATVKSVAFSPDGKTFASGSEDNTIILWDVTNVHSPTSLGEPLKGHTRVVWSVAYSPDSRLLASGSADARLILWDVDPISWQARACWIAGRNFTRAEWQQYMGEEPYRKTCEQWPLEPEAMPTP